MQPSVLPHMWKEPAKGGRSIGIRKAGTSLCDAHADSYNDFLTTDDSNPAQQANEIDTAHWNLDS